MERNGNYIVSHFVLGTTRDGLGRMDVALMSNDKIACLGLTLTSKVVWVLNTTHPIAQSTPLYKHKTQNLSPHLLHAHRVNPSNYKKWKKGGDPLLLRLYFVKIGKL